MAPHNELVSLTRSYNKWLKKKFFLEPFVPCKLKLCAQKKPEPVLAKAPSAPFKKAAPTPPEIKKQEVKVAPLPPTKPTKVEPRYELLREEFKRAHPHITLADKPLDDALAHETMQKTFGRQGASLYFFISEELSKHPFYQAVLNALKIHKIRYEDYFDADFQELSFASIPPSLKAIFIPHSLFKDSELRDDQNALFSCIKKLNGVPLYALYPPEFYTRTPKNKARLWKTISSLI